MTKEFSQAVREEAARRANAATPDYQVWTAGEMADFPFSRTLCQAILDGALHLDPVELDKARAEVASSGGYTPGLDRSPYERYRKLCIDRWTPPEPVDLVEQVARESGFGNAMTRGLRESLDKLNLDLVKREAGR